MGSSGAGKTTFMNILAQRLKRSDKKCVNGELLVNNCPIKKVPYRNFIGYVTQDDILMDTMTVKEAIMFSARLRANLSKSSAEERTDTIIHSLGLSLVKDSIIGSVAIKGISGGEKKRTAIGVELVT
mmetsp:Transcript_10525/g.1584  ORF Transcript_10525/g.1584 Transcript_10525/m.1584 type:complete len:127 (-) Transcript_10525:651-1031(-)